MSGSPIRPVACVSYLAAAELWNVARFPSANSGAEIRRIESSVAADGPVTAAVLRALDVPARLLSNPVGADARGTEVGQWLLRNRVAEHIDVAADVMTPTIVVIADDQGSRTWFPYLPGVLDALMALDLTPIDSASYAYVDCYEIVREPAIRAVHAALAAGVPLMINLGGSAFCSQLREAVAGFPGVVVQTNVDDADYRSAPDVAQALSSATRAAWVVVTAGRFGAVALDRAGYLVTVPAFRAFIRHTHCAGAAFSGGLLYGMLHGLPMGECLTLACASGAIRCERPQEGSMPNLAELNFFMSTRESISEDSGGGAHPHPG